MPLRQKLFALIISIALFFIIFELVRRRRLKEEYSWLWMLTGIVVIIMVVWYDLLIRVTNFLGMVVPTSTLFLFAFIFLMLISLHYSLRISTLTDRVKNLAQKIALLESHIEDIEKIRKNLN